MHLPTPYRGVDRRIAKPSMKVASLAALGVGGIVFATLCPIGMRPHFASPDVERFGAYGVLGLILAVAFRRRRLAVSAFVVALAMALEFGQLLIPTRDARVIDALVKAAGGLCGSSAGYAYYPARRLLQRLFTIGRAATHTQTP